MTDNEIIKALECCCEAELKEDCEKLKCPFFDNESYNCVNVDDENAMYRYSLDLISRQKAEILELEAEYEKVYEQARADILGNMSDGGTSCHWCIDGHRANAIKEFAERLKGTFPHDDFLRSTTRIISEIDNLVKEMVGAEDG